MPVFIVGRHSNLEIMRKIDKEAEQFKDILSIPAIDSYRNNTFKVSIQSKNINTKNCESSKFPAVRSPRLCSQSVQMFHTRLRVPS